MTAKHPTTRAVALAALFSLAAGCAPSETPRSMELTIANNGSAPLFISETPGAVFTLQAGDRVFGLQQPARQPLCGEGCPESCGADRRAMSALAPIEWVNYLELPPGSRWTYRWDGWRYAGRRHDSCPCSRSTHCLERSLPGVEQAELFVAYFVSLVRPHAFTPRDDGTNLWTISADDWPEQQEQGRDATFVLEADAPEQILVIDQP